MTSLRQRMLEDMQVRRLSPFTQRTYVETVARFARYFDRSPDRLGPAQIRAYQVYLATERRLATSSLLVAVAALRFLYRVTLQKRWSFDDVIPAPKKPQSLLVVLSPQEVVQFLDAVKVAKHRAILTTCYAAGLRISEAVRLTVSAIDSERMVLRITKGKGQKDRYVMLSPKLLAVLRDWWRVERPRHWLFPGERPEAPITRSAVPACLPHRLPARAPRQGRYATFASERFDIVLHLLKKAGFQGDSCLVGICPAQLAATADGFDFRLHGGQVEILAVDDPRRGGDDLRRGQGLLPDQAFDDGVADTQPRGRLLNGEPGIVVAMVGEMVIVPSVLHAVHAPRLASSGPVAESVQGGGDRGVAAHLGQLSNQIDRGPLRSHASVTNPVTRHA